MRHLLVFLSGFIFASGLVVSGMSDPAKVLAFLDLAGAWDPSLALVMAGAITVAVVPFQLADRGFLAAGGQAVQLPGPGTVDGSLIVGSILFGVGWGLVGYCPGPALLGLGSGTLMAGVFVIAMLFGVELFEWWRLNSALTANPAAADS